MANYRKQSNAEKGGKGWRELADWAELAGNLDFFFFFCSFRWTERQRAVDRGQTTVVFGANTHL